MIPLNYAILKYFTRVNEACAEDVMESLKSEYSHFKAFKKKSVIESLMTAETNFILEETRFDVDESGKPRVYYRATEDGLDIINKYIKG